MYIFKTVCYLTILIYIYIYTYIYITKCKTKCRGRIHSQILCMPVLIRLNGNNICLFSCDEKVRFNAPLAKRSKAAAQPREL